MHSRLPVLLGHLRHCVFHGKLRQQKLQQRSTCMHPATLCACMVHTHRRLAVPASSDSQHHTTHISIVGARKCPHTQCMRGGCWQLLGKELCFQKNAPHQALCRLKPSRSSHTCTLCHTLSACSQARSAVPSLIDGPSRHPRTVS